MRHIGRSRQQFPVITGLDYQVIAAGSLVNWGRGRTVNISSCVLLFEAQEPLPLGRRIELWIAWPAGLKENAGLTLFVIGRVVRTLDNFVSVEFSHYEFRTRSLNSLGNSAAGAV